ncbi:MAG TPA: polyprenyl synthetase family protein, partial [Planctomycetota bacterium]|nr:polyprenyl synthetase family protein [Planctomycetota bacterium]
DCKDTAVDLDWVWNVVHLTSEDRTRRMDLDALRRDVEAWFTPAALEEIMGPPAGHADAVARSWLAGEGKRWRPFLTACAYRALSEGADGPLPPALRKVAVAVECFHKASLVHDDIEDADEMRYGEKTLHAEVGVPVALNAGDFLLGEGYRLLGDLSVDPAVRVDMLRLAAAGHVTLSRGQGRELLWTRDPSPLSSMDVLEIFREKTAPAFEVALRLGAFLGGADADTHDVLRKYSECLGIGYQIKDDLEDWSGEGDSRDLEDLRPSLLLAIAHKRAEDGEEKAALDALCRRRARWSEVGPLVRRVLRERGVLDKADELLEAYKEDAVRSLRFLANATLKGLLRRVVGKILGERLIEGYCSEFEARNAAGRAPGAQPAAGGR